MHHGMQSARIEKAYPVDYYWLWMPEGWLDGSGQVSFYKDYVVH